MENFKLVIAYFLSPLSMALSLLLIGWCLKLRKREKPATVFPLAASVLLLLGSFSGWTYEIRRQREFLYPPFEIAEFDVPSNQGTTIMVLGTGLNADETLPANSQVTSSFVSRLLEAVRIQRGIPSAKLVISVAGDAEPTAKQQFLDDMISILSLKPADVQFVTDFKSTEDEAQAIEQLYPDNQIILVTSAGHMRRAVQTFQQADLTVLAAPTDYRCTRAASPNDKPWQRWIPSEGGIASNQQFLCETVADSLRTRSG